MCKDDLHRNAHVLHVRELVVEHLRDRHEERLLGLFHLHVKVSFSLLEGGTLMRKMNYQIGLLSLHMAIVTRRTSESQAFKVQGIKERPRG